MTKDHKPLGTFLGGEEYENGVYFSTDKFRGVVFGIWGRRGAFITPTYPVSTPGDKECIANVKAKIVDELKAVISSQDQSWRKVIYTGSGKHSGKTLEYIYSNDLTFLVGLRESTDLVLVCAVERALEHKNNIDPWARY